VPKKLFGPKMGEGSEQFAIPYNEKLRDSYRLSSIVRTVKCVGLLFPGRVARMGDTRNAYIIPVGKPIGKRSLV
jgi:hypothetical protein